MAKSPEHDKLASLLGEEAAVLLSKGPNAAAFTAAAEQLAKEHSEDLVGKAKDKIKAMLAAKAELDAIDTEYQNKRGKALKTFNKLLNSLKAAMNGQPEPKEGDKENNGESGGGDADAAPAG